MVSTARQIQAKLAFDRDCVKVPTIPKEFASHGATYF
jgi:hypothetical protein